MTGFCCRHRIADRRAILPRPCRLLAYFSRASTPALRILVPAGGKSSMTFSRLRSHRRQRRARSMCQSSDFSIAGPAYLAASWPAPD
jgi:hypothetical protein